MRAVGWDGAVRVLPHGGGPCSMLAAPAHEHPARSVPSGTCASAAPGPRPQVMNATASGARLTALTVAQQALKQEGARVGAI